MATSWRTFAAAAAALLVAVSTLITMPAGGAQKPAGHNGLGIPTVFLSK